VANRNDIAEFLKDAVDFAAPAPRKTLSDVQIVRVKMGQVFQAFILEDKMTEVQTHWVDERSLPCLEPKRRCPWCEKHMRQRWYGYLPCQVCSTGRLCLLQVTPGLHRAIPELQLGNDLLHRRITVKRVSPGTRGRLTGTIDKFNPPGLTFHPTPNVREILSNIWSGPLSELMPDLGME